ncbi:Protein VACL-14 [Aphelenchoides avenae]|nr:Protein VACL-14 [Aphelenchus avenae]
MATENPYAPLTQSVVRTLTDKLYEKRKAAALEIEKQVRELQKNGSAGDLDRLIAVLENLIVTPNGNCRKGGVIGLAAVAIALGKNSPPYAGKLISPVLSCFADLDSRVRYFACESLYNIVKICRAASLEFFGDIFDVLWKLASDTDQNVRSGSELLDRLVKEIVISAPDFDLECLMVLVRERIYNTNSSNRRFIISWLHSVLTVPRFSITCYIPEVVDGVFQILEDPAPAVRDATVSVLIEMLHKLDPNSGEEVEIGNIINILVNHATTSTSILAREIALTWLDQICAYYLERVLPHLSALLVAALPSVHDNSLKASELNGRLVGLVTADVEVPVDAVVKVLAQHLKHDRTETKIAALNWVRLLHSTHPVNMFGYMEKFFPILLEMLSDTADDVLMLDIMLITDMCGKADQSADIKSFKLADSVKEELRDVSPYLVKFSISLLQMFKNDPRLVAERGIQIIRQLCLLLSPSDVYRSLALLLPTFDTDYDVEFIARIVAILNRILLTAAELFHLRNQLRNPEVNDCVELFECLYKCWSHQPICLISLCLMSQYYAHAAELVTRLSEIEITVELLTEIDRLVQLIESPIMSPH